MDNSYRLDQIYKLLLSKGTASVAELADTFKVTKTTMRRDLLEMEEQGLVTRTRGYASVRSNQPNHAASLIEDKARIAEVAVKLIRTNMSLALDAGYTVELLMERLIKEPSVSMVSILTYSLPLAIRVAPYYRVSLPSGSVYAGELTISSSNMDDQLTHINTDIAFLATNGIADCPGLTTSYQPMIPNKTALANNAAMRVGLADSSKYYMRGLYTYIPFERLDKLITIETADNGPQLERIAKTGVEIILA